MTAGLSASNAAGRMGIDAARKRAVILCTSRIVLPRPKSRECAALITEFLESAPGAGKSFA